VLADEGGCPMDRQVGQPHDSLQHRPDVGDDRSGKRSVLRSMERHVADRQHLLDLLATWL
jgi:hypothetical protein